MNDQKMDSELSAAVATILHHQVRKTLMGDLGLTRESVQREARAIVEDAVKKSIGTLIDSGAIQRYINDYLTKQLNLRDLCQAEVKRSVNSIVEQKLNVHLNHN
jgi:hypothetical protein